MKKTAITVITALLLVAGAFAQTQNGVVKTRGRMVNGKVVPKGEEIERLHKIEAERRKKRK